MTDREKLIELLYNVPGYVISCDELADYLIANGVTIPVRCKDCTYYYGEREYCGFWGECRHPEHFCDEGVKEDG